MNSSTYHRKRKNEQEAIMLNALKSICSIYSQQNCVFRFYIDLRQILKTEFPHNARSTYPKRNLNTSRANPQDKQEKRDTHF